MKGLACASRAILGKTRITSGCAFTVIAGASDARPPFWFATSSKVKRLSSEFVTCLLPLAAIATTSKLAIKTMTRPARGIRLKEYFPSWHTSNLSPHRPSD